MSQPVPTLFGVPMDDLMAPVRPGQGLHHDFYLYLWGDLPPEGYAIGISPNETPPDWFLEVELYLGHHYSLMNGTVREAHGYATHAGCSATGGLPASVRNPEIVGQLDPSAPDTLYLGRPNHACAADWFDETLVAVQWSAPAADGPPPPMFGQPFQGPNEDGEYTLRLWIYPNGDGLFAEAHPHGFTCP